MKLNTKTRYGARALLALARSESEPRPLSSSEIAQQEGISVKYLEGLLGILRSAGFVHSIRGAAGGYRLGRDPSEINMKQMYDLFEGSEGFVECTTEPSLCRRSTVCATQTIWNELFILAMRYLESITLADLLERDRKFTETEALLYEI
ncbi:MAG: RrF2 family transcriptional regulator [Anaerolineae bacterium]